MKINWNIIIAAVIAATPPTILSVANLVQAQKIQTQGEKTHDLVNSKMTELVDSVRAESAATATLKEKKSEQERKDKASR